MPSPVRVELVESHAGLRADLSRALAASGFRVAAHERAGPQLRASDRAGEVSVLDLAAPGVTTALAERGELSRTIVLVSEAALAEGRLPIRADGPMTLTKPFEYPALEALILMACDAGALPRHRAPDPLLETAQPALARVFERARRLAQKPVSICITGELGSGRRALARAIHDWSPRAARPFEGLERSMLEGLEDRAGAIDGVVEGIVEGTRRARDGTLVVVEPAELPTAGQRALLATLRAADRDRSPRWLCVSTRPLDELVAEGRLAPELHYRLEDACLAMPALRERPGDHAAICRSLVRRLSRQLGEPAPEIDERVVAVFAREGFRGNRLGLESRLRNALIRVAAGEGDLERVLTGESSARPADARDALPSVHLKTLERDAIVRALAHRDGNRTRASEDLGINVRTLRNKIREYGLR